MVSSALDWLLIAHFQSPWSPSLQIYQIDRIVANSALSADIIYPHPPKNYDKSIFVKNGWVIAPRWWNSKLFVPSIGIKRKYLSDAKRSTTMPTDYNSHILIACGSVPFSGLRFPALKFVLRSRKCVFDVFGNIVDSWFFDNFSNFSVQSRQPFLFVVIYVQYFLVLEWLFDVVVQLVLSNVRELCFDARKLLFVLFQHFEQASMVLLQSALSPFGSTSEAVFPIAGQLEFVEIVETLVNGGYETILLDSGISPRMPFG